MQTIEEAYEAAAELYWIAFLLTGHSDRSANIVIKEIERGNEREDGLSSPGSIPVRRAAVAKAMASISDELALSAALMTSRQTRQSPFAGQNWSVNPALNQEELTAALLRIEAFPRCALLLTVFEGLTIDTAAALLQSDRELAISGRIAGLYELTRNLALVSGLEFDTDAKEKTFQLQSQGGVKRFDTCHSKE